AAAQPDLAQLREPLGRRRLPDAKRQRALLLEALPEADRAEPAVLVVERCDPARRGDLDSVAHGRDVLLGWDLDEPALELPGSLFVEHSRRLAPVVPDDDSALDLEIAVREREGGGVEPERVVVLRDQHR